MGAVEIIFGIVLLLFALAIIIVAVSYTHLTLPTKLEV